MLYLDDIQAKCNAVFPSKSLEYGFKFCFFDKIRFNASAEVLTAKFFSKLNGKNRNLN